MVQVSKVMDARR